MELYERVSDDGSIRVYVEGGPADGRAFSIPACSIDRFPRRAVYDDATYRFVSDIDDAGFIRCRYVLDRLPASRVRTRRRQRRQLPYAAVEAMKTVVVWLLERGCTWRDIENATDVPYARWLSERKYDEAFATACVDARERARG